MLIVFRYCKTENMVEKNCKKILLWADEKKVSMVENSIKKVICKCGLSEKQKMILALGIYLLYATTSVNFRFFTLLNHLGSERRK